jgi:RNA polymerase sigma-70 factor, ECF subfamily
VLQAAIAGVHAVAPSFEETDWPRIVRLYDSLLGVWSSPVVALNRAAALAFAEGADVGLAEIDRLAGDGRLAGYPYLPAARADLLRRLGRDAEAASAYEVAIALTTNAAEREFLARRRAELPTSAAETGAGQAGAAPVVPEGGRRSQSSSRSPGASRSRPSEGFSPA